MRGLLLSCALAAVVGLTGAPLASADTIDEMVKGTGALESPFWRSLYENGYGYLDAQRVSNDGKIACVNRQAGVPPYQITPLMQSRGYTSEEAWAIVLAEEAASESAHAVC
ncbi:hypothetical protein JDV09_26300 [Mycobacterium sp. Y57]|uniref:hypothetical protein n=1 Tax=Mycolicibacterium xanthum TaxID=2796469 RepID=UPI001C843419|nr:hypothetical protein [Mycolicibacterium xanthum]MBX7435574.1 hypothetical protein [Mycolicibacterium xanthum]